jgi:hypothetical protein
MSSGVCVLEVLTRNAISQIKQAGLSRYDVALFDHSHQREVFLTSIWANERNQILAISCNSQFSYDN